MDRWLGVEIRHLAALAAIDEERSFRGAADRLGYVQSAVSQQLSRLETLVGVRLVERARGHARVELTSEGQLLLRHAHRMLGQMQAAQADLEQLSSGVSALRIGTFPSAASQIMPRVLSRMAVDRPEIEITTTEAASDAELFAAVEAGSLDAAFAELPLEEGPFEHRELMSETCVLVVPAGSPLAAAGTPPTLAEIAALPLVTNPGWRMGRLVDRVLRATGRTPDYRFKLVTNSAILALVSTGLAAAVMPALAVDRRVEGIEVIELDELLPRRTLALFWHRERSPRPALEELARTAQAACADLNWREREREPIAA